jgi:hypothetical protein
MKTIWDWHFPLAIRYEKYPRQESNLDEQLRRLPRYPLRYGGKNLLDSNSHALSFADGVLRSPRLPRHLADFAPDDEKRKFFNKPI